MQFNKHSGLYPIVAFGFLGGFSKSTSFAAFQLLGKQPFWNKLLNAFNQAISLFLITAFIISGGILSGPGAVFAFSLFAEFKISSFVKKSHLLMAVGIWETVLWL